jgi:hypothetical protein
VLAFPEFLFVTLLSGKLLHELALAGREFGGDFDFERDEVVAATAGVYVRYTLATEFEDFAALGAGRNPQLQLAVDGFDGNFGAEGRLHHGDFGVGENVLIMPFETARFNPNMDVEVAFALG